MTAPNESLKHNMENPRAPENSTETFEKTAVIDVARAMENATTEAEMKKSVNIFFDLFPKTLRIEFSSNVTPLYQEMARERLLVRLERPSVILESLLENIPIRLGSGTDRYANAVVPDNEGIKIALSEGMAPGPIRLLMGFDVRSAIGFRPAGLNVQNISISESDLRDTSIRIALCRHVTGDLLPQNIKIFVIRVPRHLLHQRHLTETERNRHPQFVFRGVRLPEKSSVSS